MAVLPSAERAYTPVRTFHPHRSRPAFGLAGSRPRSAHVSNVFLMPCIVTGRPSSALRWRVTMVFPSNACLELTLYFKSPSLGKIMFIAVDASPDDNSEVERLPEGIAELTKR
jgi:hypothetical protein